MIITSGFTYNGFKFGFKKQVLYRLPSHKSGREYPLKIVPVIQLSNTSKGFRLCRDKKSVLQVRSMIEKVKWKINDRCLDCL